MTPDFYGQVPKGLVENLRYRLALRRACREDAELRRCAWTASKHDVLYFFNAFCWLYEPRPRVVEGRRLPVTIPFLTWEHQDPCIRQIKQHLGREDIGLEKSRGEGASWIAVLLALHDWLFEPMTAIGLVSKDEDSVDNPEDPDSLMWKLDWELGELPNWMVPQLKRRQEGHTLRNLDNGSTITGYAATGNVASGGRKKWFLQDELAKFPKGRDREAMASTQHVTESRLVVSTPKGSEGAYYDLMHEPSNLVKIILDWKDNPFRNRGLYRYTAQGPELLDPGNPLPSGYWEESRALFSRLHRKGFKLEGSIRSPWYDHECDRPGATPQNIAQELDRDYGGSMFRIFGADFFAKAEGSIRPPLKTGQFSYHPETLEGSFDAVDGGPASLWCSLDVRGTPPKHGYVVGADVSAGGGGSHTSNSAAVVFDSVTLEQVFEFASPSIPPSDFADYCVALAKWFHGAYLVSEANGPGAGFIQRVLDVQYPNLFRRTVLWRRGRKKDKKVGWWTDRNTKEKMFSEMERSVRTGELTLRSKVLVGECGQYVRANNKIVHVLSATTADESARGEAHGDRVIAACVCLQGIRDRPHHAEPKQGTWSNPPPGSMAERLKIHEARLKEAADPWDTRTNAEMASPYD